MTISRGRTRRAASVGYLTLAAVIVAACSSAKPPAPAPTEQSSLIQPDCYTVDPYTKIRIAAPSTQVPQAMRAFSGVWGGGAWDGRVCHDLYVMQIEPSGTVVMFDAHGPGFFADATAFTRKGVIGEDGRLRVRKGRAEVEYWIENGRLYGTRRIGNRVNRIIMTRKS